ncbi:glycerophosphodiester phosphodiesterase [Shouchella rhizosphaerae]|uniref:Glycerophosphodiester phosphodiesterase n=1 Tax=Shouchella rhizosphaerae TaxID=866786 RepID=A0ABZ2CN92_9BACI
MKKTNIYGHRGAMGTHPENTLLSFQAALEQGADGVELDIQVTKDGELVVIHDDTVDRTTDGTGYVHDYSLRKLKALSAGCRFNHFPEYEPSWDQERIPTLQEVLCFLAPFGTEANIELKPHLAKHKGIERRVLETVQAWGSQTKIIYSSFHMPMLLRLKQLNNTANIAWLLNINLPLAADYMSCFQFESLHVDRKILLTEGNAFEQEGLLSVIRAWTVNQDQEIRQLLAKGVGTIMTDYPSRAIVLRDGMI